MKHKNQNGLSQIQLIAMGFFIIIVTGTLLLMLPCASQEGTGALDALFTATSATCVTGLVAADTCRHWTLFGQLVILALIQTGGLGFMTIGVFFSIYIRRKISLRERELLQESINTMQLAGVVRLTKLIVKGTLLLEGVGAFLLALRFVPQFGFVKGCYYGIFHSVSAFCNSGFDLMGEKEAYASLTAYAADPLVNLVIMGLIIAGGIGFIVWQDVYSHGLHIRKYMLHTKIVLLMSAGLVFGGGFLFWLFERHALFAGHSPGTQILEALFSSVTARTAGFNTVDTGALSHGSKLLTMILMFIGGSPGSTAGGVKTTTIIVMYLHLWSSIQRTYGVNAFGRRLEDDVLKRASAIFMVNLTLALGASLFIMATQQFPVMDVLFESFSASGTVGMTTGITRDLNSWSRLVIAFLMYCGRVGSLSFALSFTQHKKVARVQQPVGRITIG